MMWLSRFRALRTALAPSVLAAVPLVYETSVPPGGHGELDSPAVWIAPDPSRSLLFVTDKTLDYVEVHDPVQNTYVGRFGGSGSEPGRFQRPNSVAVAYAVPSTTGPQDVLFVVERDNQRVSAFLLPWGLYLGAFGSSSLQEPMGIGLHWESGQLQAWVTDIGFAPDRVVVFGIAITGTGLAGTPLFTFNAPANAVLESILIDPVERRALVCDEGSGHDVMVFDLAGQLVERFGSGVFVDDPEGIALWDAGGGEGYLIVADQQALPVQFEVFGRREHRWLGHFTGATNGTDGVALVQQSLPNLPGGSFFAAHEDRAVHAYSWTDIAAAMHLCSQGPCAPVDASVQPAARERLAVAPNPCNPAATIQWGLDAPSRVRLAVHDLRGRRVAELLDAEQPAGLHALVWDGRNASGAALPSGVYVLRLRAGERTEITKLTLVQ